MKDYHVWYAREFDPFCKSKIEPGLEKTHTFISLVAAVDLDEVFSKMQGEVWSPNGEARKQIEKAGTDHTSMSVGDIAVEKDTEKAFRCENYGWAALN